MAGAGGRTRQAGMVLAALALVAACTGGDGPDTSTPTVDRAAPAGGGTMRLGLPGAATLDPVDASLGSPTDQLVLDLLYDGLTRVDGDGAVQPALADEWVHNDGLTAWRFTLDTEATFASGRPLTNQDVVDSIERVVANGNTSLAALALESVTGFRAFVDGDADHLAGLSAPGVHTVRIALDHPLSTLPVVLASPAFGVVDQESLEAAAADGTASDLDLSGSWAVTGADGGDLTLERRPDAPGHLDGVELRAYDDADAAYDAFTDGDVDWATVPPARFDDAVDDYGDDHFAPFQAELFFGLNLGSAPLGNAYLRLAIEAAVDREAIVKAVYADLADPLPTVIPVGVPGHDDERCGGCGPDPERAADLVAAAFPDGDVPTINIDYDESSVQEEMARIIADDLDQAGIPTKLRPLPLEEYKTFVASGAQQLFTIGWIGAYTSPDAYLAPLFVSDSDDNLTAYRDAAVDGLLSRARGADDDEKDAARWAQAEEDVMDAAVVIPIAQFRTQVVVDERVQGWVHAVDGTVDWAQVSLSG